MFKLSVMIRIHTLIYKNVTIKHAGLLYRMSNKACRLLNKIRNFEQFMKLNGITLFKIKLNILNIIKNITL